MHFWSWLGRSPGERDGNPLQYSCLEIPWTQEPGGLQSTGCKGSDLTEATERAGTHACLTWLRAHHCLTAPLAAPHPQVEALLHLAHQNRAVARTAQNERSSRSHSVFQLQISGEHAGRGLQCAAPLSLVDLAGSERLDPGLALGPGERERLRETQAINSSLSTLGLVIMALSNKVGMGVGAGGPWEAAGAGCPQPCPNRLSLSTL